MSTDSCQAQPSQGKASQALCSLWLSPVCRADAAKFFSPLILCFDLYHKYLPRKKKNKRTKKKQCFLFSSHFCIQTFDSRRFFQSTVKLFHESEDLRDIFHRSFHFLPRAMISPRQPARLCTGRFSCATIWRLTCAKYLPSTPTFYRSLPSVLVSVKCDI